MQNPECLKLVSQKSSVKADYFQLNNSFTEQLPADNTIDNYTRQVTGAAYSYVLPTTVNKPSLIARSQSVAYM